MIRLAIVAGCALALALGALAVMGATWAVEILVTAGAIVVMIVVGGLVR
ncbi:MAG: hypothetical protein M0020_01115 [Actinomycetota bacterium]|nr:hypothetical protein [Actinomycetota bacterium]